MSEPFEPFSLCLCIVENNIAQILSRMPKNPTTAQVTEAFKDCDDILIPCFVVDAEDDIFHVKNITGLTHGQPIWRKTEVMLSPVFCLVTNL